MQVLEKEIEEYSEEGLTSLLTATIRESAANFSGMTTRDFNMRDYDSIGNYIVDSTRHMQPPSRSLNPIEGRITNDLLKHIDISTKHMQVPSRGSNYYQEMAEQAIKGINLVPSRSSNVRGNEPWRIIAEQTTKGINIVPSRGVLPANVDHIMEQVNKASKGLMHQWIPSRSPTPENIDLIMAGHNNEAEPFYKRSSKGDPTRTEIFDPLAHSKDLWNNLPKFETRVYTPPKPAERVDFFAHLPKPELPAYTPSKPTEADWMTEHLKKIKERTELYKDLATYHTRPEIEPTKTTQTLEATRASVKIRDSDTLSPLMRLDLKQHEKKPSIHLQYGSHLYTGRSGHEAADIMGTVLKENPAISWANPVEPPIPDYIKDMFDPKKQIESLTNRYQKDKK
jgi:hypothetical protein